MDLYNDPEVREVWIMKSAQVGMTEALNNIIGYIIDRKPGPMMIMQPTVEMVEAWSKDRLAPMLESSPALRAKVSQPRSKDGANTLRHKTGPGWRLSMSGANSAAGLRMRSVRDLFCDEIDVYPENTGKDGDPISQARKRQVTFWNRKLFVGSTPTVKGASAIEAGFEKTDMRFLHLPCPHCTKEAGELSGFQRLRWPQIKWNDGDPNSAAYQCEHCGKLIGHHEKQWMLDRRKWVATKPFDGVVGLHIWEAYSNFVTWAEIVQEFLKAKDLPDKLQTWVNTSLGETYIDEGNTPKAEGLLARRESYTAETVPAGVLLITMGTDVQDDRLESTIYGYGADEQCWRLGQIILRGDPGGSALWAEHDEVLKRRFPTDDGRTLVIEAACVDSGGHFTQHVYAYCQKRTRNRVWAIKGAAGVGRLIWPRQATRTKKTRAMVWIIGVDTAKDLIYTRLNKVDKPGPGYIHFDADTTQGWLDQLTSEVKTFKTLGGRKVAQFKPKTTEVKQEGLDTTVYAYAAMVGRGGAALLSARAKHHPKQIVPIDPTPPAAEHATTSNESVASATAAAVDVDLKRPIVRRFRRPGWAGTWRK